jgi:hypothetical protein
MKRPILRGFCGALAILIAGSAFAAAAPDKPKLVVLDIELTGDLGGPKFTAEHETRLRMESDELRQELGQSELYTVVDTTPAQPLITKLKSQQSYLHDCNGCDLEIGRQLGANQVLVTWVDRVSGLILSLTYEFHDVSSGQIVGRKSYDFRGDNDSAWTHAVKYMVRDLKESAATRAAAAAAPITAATHATTAARATPPRGRLTLRPTEPGTAPYLLSRSLLSNLSISMYSHTSVTNSPKAAYHSM